LTFPAELQGAEGVYSPPASWEIVMGRGILLWLIGVPIPIIILLALFVR
jgi:hypothetical protein